jgi:hypothetical protein
MVTKMSTKLILGLVNAIAIPWKLIEPSATSLPSLLLLDFPRHTSVMIFSPLKVQLLAQDR